MKFLDLFGGIGGFRLGLENASNEFECVGYIDNDKYAVKSYNAIFDEDHEPKDAKEIDAEELPDFDILCGGFPCFPSGTPITTKQGIKSIEDVVEGDEVLTHEGRFKKVNEVMKRETKKMYRIKTMYGIEFLVTEEHPFLAVQRKQSWNNKERKYDKYLSEPKWVKAKNLEDDMKLGFQIQRETEEPEFTTKLLVNSSDSKRKVSLPVQKQDFWWLVGYYVGNGYYQKRRIRREKECRSQRVTISCNDEELKKVLDIVKKIFPKNTPHIEEARTCNKIHIINRAFYDFVKRLGDEASEKRFPPEFITLPIKYLRRLVEGYNYADGTTYENKIKGTTVSKKLANDLQLAYSIVYGGVAGKQYVETKDKIIIEGREVNQRDYYNVRCQKKSTRFIQEKNGKKWINIQEVEEIDKEKTVYNLEVEEDNTYVANNLAVHNCQSWSLAGHRKGLKDNRGTLFFDIVRIAKEKQPKYLFLENVKGLLTHTNENDEYSFDGMMKDLCRIGYAIDFTLLNSKNFGVPQNRERVFILARRKDTLEDDMMIEGYSGTGSGKKTELDPEEGKLLERTRRRLFWNDNITFWASPLPEQGSRSTKSLKSVLEKNPEDKYFLSEEKTQEILEKMDEKEI